MFSQNRRIAIIYLIFCGTFCFAFSLFPWKREIENVDNNIVGNITTPKQFNCSYYENISRYGKAKKWPRIDLFLPLAPIAEAVSEFQGLFLPSYTLFWPLRKSQTPLIIVTDREANGTKPVDDIQQLAIDWLKVDCSRNFRFKFALNSLPDGVKMEGHDRQQWLMFWADNFTSPDAEYVGFVDSDTVFVTRVTLTDLFDKQRPIIRPLFGKPTGDWWAKVPRSTYAAIGKIEPFNCMTYFPVLIEAAHLHLIREHVRLRLNATTFDEAFLSIVRDKADKPYSQFNIFCAYLWYYQRNSYKWSIGRRDNTDWFGAIPVEMASTLDEAGISPDLMTGSQTPHLTLHWSYETFKDEPNAFRDVIATGVCYSMPENFKARPQFCKDLIGPNRNESINVFEWRFESFVKVDNLTAALEAHRRRLKTIDKVPPDWDFDTLKQFSNNSLK